jgi:hypothetical protein
MTSENVFFVNNGAAWNNSNKQLSSNMLIDENHQTTTIVQQECAVVESLSTMAVTRQFSNQTTATTAPASNAAPTSETVTATVEVSDAQEQSTAPVFNNATDEETALRTANDVVLTSAQPGVVDNRSTVAAAPTAVASNVATDTPSKVIADDANSRPRIVMWFSKKVTASNNVAIAPKRKSSTSQTGPADDANVDFVAPPTLTTDVKQRITVPKNNDEHSSSVAVRVTRVSSRTAAVVASSLFSLPKQRKRSATAVIDEKQQPQQEDQQLLPQSAPKKRGRWPAKATKPIEAEPVVIAPALYTKCCSCKSVSVLKLLLLLRCC